jgi:hypothetical protein
MDAVGEPVQHGVGHSAVVVEDFRPVFIGLAGGQQDGSVLVTLTDIISRILSSTLSAVGITISA